MKKLYPVSVVIPTYNSEKTILRALDSVIQQTCLPNEIIIIDDSSKDNTCDIINNYISNQVDIKIYLIRNQVNLGAGVSRNTAIENCKYKYIAFLDSDDSWHPQKIEFQFNFMEGNLDYDISAHSYKVVKKLSNITFYDKISISYFSLNDLLIKNRGLTPSLMIRRSAKERFSNERIGEDRYLVFNIVKRQKKIPFITLPLVYLFKAEYGQSGLSEGIVEGWIFEKLLLKKLKNEKTISNFTYYWAICFWFIKFLKRLIYVYIKKSCTSSTNKIT